MACSSCGKKTPVPRPRPQPAKSYGGNRIVSGYGKPIVKMNFSRKKG